MRPTRGGGGRERLKRVNEVGDGRLDLVEAQSRRRSGSRLRRALSAPQNTWESIASSSSILEHGRRVKAGCSGERCVECNGRAAGCSSLSLSLSAPRPTPLIFPPLPPTLAPYPPLLSSFLLCRRPRSSFLSLRLVPVRVYNTWFPRNLAKLFLSISLLITFDV